MIIFLLLSSVLVSERSFCQESVKDTSVKTIIGRIATIDSVGGSIVVQTNAGDMTFYFSDQTKMVRDVHDPGAYDPLDQEVHDIGPLDINQEDVVTIQYDSSLPGERYVISLEDNSSPD